MYELCINIGGTKHCFPIPSLIQQFHIPPPHNYPQLEVAIAALELARIVPGSELSNELSQVANKFIQSVQKALPQGVELAQEKAAKKAA